MTVGDCLLSKVTSVREREMISMIIAILAIGRDCELTYMKEANVCNTAYCT